MYSEVAKSKIENLKSTGLYRQFININKICSEYPLASIGNNTKKEVVVWCSNDYLGMSEHSNVINAMHKAIESYGAGSGGSRNISGTNNLFYLLEASLAEWHHKESALVFTSGYNSNEASLECLAKIFDNCIIFSDENNHASLINGIKNSKLEKKIFRHNDVKHLQDLLEEQPLSKPKIIVFESIYSMDGDIAPVVEILVLAKKYNALTFLDEVHAIGMYGPRGEGIAAKLKIQDEIDIIQGTMAKSIGLIGGYISGNKDIVDAIRSFSDGFIFTTSLPPVITAGCYASIEYLKKSNKERDLLQMKTEKLRTLFNEFQIPLMKISSTHILPVLIGDAIKCKNAAERLLDKHNIYLQPINSPSVPLGTERFRINVTPNHTQKQMVSLVEGLVEVFNYLDIPFVKEE